MILLKDETDSNIIHFIWAGLTYGNVDAIKKRFQLAMAANGIQKAIITFLRRTREYCITKEKVVEFTGTGKDAKKKGGKIYLNEEKDRGVNVEESIGEDLEDLFSRINNGELNEDETGPYGVGIYTFNVELVTKNDRRKLENGDEQFKRTFAKYIHYKKNPDVPKEEMEQSESDLKFALSLCRRFTYLISAETEENAPESDSESYSESDLESDSEILPETVLINDRETDSESSP